MVPLIPLAAALAEEGSKRLARTATAMWRQEASVGTLRFLDETLAQGASPGHASLAGRAHLMVAVGIMMVWRAATEITGPQSKD